MPPCSPICTRRPSLAKVLDVPRVKSRPADDVEDHVDTLTIGQIAHGLNEIRRPVIDRQRAKALARRALVVGPRRRERRCTERYRELNSSGADAALATMDQDSLALMQRRALKEIRPHREEVLQIAAAYSGSGAAGIVQAPRLRNSTKLA